MQPLKKINFHRIFVSSAILGMLLTYVLLTARMLNDPVQRTASDFMPYYAAGMIAHREGIARIYELNLQRAVEQSQVNFQLGEKQFLIYNHPPYLIPVLSILVSPNYILSFSFWMILLGLAGAASICTLQKILGGIPTNLKRTIIFSALLFQPVFTSIVNGQDTLFILLGLSFFVYNMFKGNENIAGLGLALLTLRPQMVIFFALPVFIWSRKAFRSFFLGAALLTFISLLMLGQQGSLDFIQTLRISSSGEWFGMNEAAMFNLLGLSLRLFPGADLFLMRQAAWILFIGSAILTAILFARIKMDPEDKFALSAIIFILVSPHLHYHDLSLLLIPAFILVRKFEKSEFSLMKKMSMYILAASLLVFFSNFVPVLFYTVPYLLMGLMVFVIMTQNRFQTPAIIAH
ncbi:MAG: glycosyltransferase 87 family protein [Chloroflexota bacterium]